MKNKKNNFKACSRKCTHLFVKQFLSDSDTAFIALATNKSQRKFNRSQAHLVRAKVKNRVQQFGQTVELPGVAERALNKLRKMSSRRATHWLVMNFCHVTGVNHSPFAGLKKHRLFNRSAAMVARVRVMSSIIAFALLFSSCATILGKSNKAHQRHKPNCGEPKREIRVGYLVADILLCPVVGLIIDFSTGKIYHPTPDPLNVKVCEGGSK